jgi:phosphatidylglycerophosphate synthase
MQRTPPRARLRHLPNLLSFSRLPLAALFVPATRELRLVLLVVAGITDLLDGWIARRSHSQSRLGALIDPSADRVFGVVAVSTFLASGQLSTLGYFVFLTRDLMTAIGFIVARTVRWLRPVELKARWPGKIVTVLQFAVLFALVLELRVVSQLLVVVGIASLWAVADYTLALWRARAR